MKIALHVHTTYSDGELSVAEVGELFRKKGCSAVLLADHAEGFDAERLKDYVAECHDLSDPAFLLLPGLEFECPERMHILGYGVHHKCESNDPGFIIKHIGDHGGISVIAHPEDALFPRIEELDALPNGIEVWNSKCDGRWAPRPGTFRLIQRMRLRRASLRAFYGIDLHWRLQPAELLTILDEQKGGPERDAILNALLEGRFSCDYLGVTLPSTGEIDSRQLEAWGEAFNRNRRFRNAMYAASRFAKGVDIRPPAALKAFLRRFF